MNIKKAKEEIRDTVRAYLQKDENGNYRIPAMRQRPLLLMGPPGVGKTQIIEQVARECGVGLVAYTITHHTRQSAVGLPFILKKTYGGREYSVTEYTMSEIIASVYDRMEHSGLKEGILFIDEINCVSETLVPTMLQFLQNKTFGNQKVPEGWIIVAAGNPPEYNRSAHEFDIVTLDRVRRIDVEPDLAVWKEYAYRQAIHGAIIAYLQIRPENFFRIETTPDGIRFATARGWEDLSEMMEVCETLGLPVDRELVVQYIQNEAVAKDFANYYELYNKYRADYRVDEILAGRFSEQAVDKLKHAQFDERLSVIGLLLSRLNGKFRQAYRNDLFTEKLFGMLKDWKARLRRKEDGRVGEEEETATRHCLRALEQYAEALRLAGRPDAQAAFAQIKREFEKETGERSSFLAGVSAALGHAFDFMAVAFGESQEMVVFVTELTVNFYSAKFIEENGSEQYYTFNHDLMLSQRRQKTLKDLDALESGL